MGPYLPGEWINNRYEVASRPLLGGMGVVYLCLDRQTNQPVALKTFKHEYLSDRDARDRFLREGTAWMQFGKHQNIVQCYGVERSDNGLEIFLVLELVAKPEERLNASLRAWLFPGQPLPIDQALMFALQIARGMKHASTILPGFVHRDLKPDNLLVGADPLPGSTIPRLRVTDFGLASVLEQFGQLTSNVEDEKILISLNNMTYGIIGSPPYMAPEQWRGVGFGTHTDIFSFGAILYEMLSGSRAILGNTKEEIQKNCLSGNLAQMPANLPSSLVNFITTCLAANPQDRLESWNKVTQVLDELSKTLTGRELPEIESQSSLEQVERVRLCWAYNSIGTSYMDISQNWLAIKYFEQVYSNGKVEGETVLECTGLANLGLAYTYLGEVQKAVEFNEKALDILQNIGSRRAEGNILGNMGFAMARIGEEQKAISFQEQALAIHQETGNRHGEASALGNLGNSYQKLGDVTKAIGYFNQQLKISRLIGDRSGEGIALGNLGNAHVSLVDLEKAITFYNQSLIIDHEIGDKRSEGTDLCNLGTAYAALGKIKQAINSFEQALVISREIGDRRGEGNAFGNLGNAYAELGEVNQAKRYYEQQLAISREIKDRFGEGIVIGNLGNLFARLGNLSQAIEYFNQALTIDRELGYRQGEGTDLGNLGNAYAVLGNSQQAIVYYEQAMIISRDIKDLVGEATNSLNLAMLFSELNLSHRALPLAQQAARIYAQIGERENLLQARQLIAYLESQPPSNIFG